MAGTMEKLSVLFMRSSFLSERLTVGMGFQQAGRSFFFCLRFVGQQTSDKMLSLGSELPGDSGVLRDRAVRQVTGCSLQSSGRSR